MTGVFLVCVVAMFFVVKKVGGNSAKHMVAQQHAIATEEGFVEEMMKGQKVVKVFTHEEEAKKDFDQLNENLYVHARDANIFGNVLGPILSNIGNFTYVLMATVGGILLATQILNPSLASIFKGVSPITLGLVIPFLGMSKRCTQAVNELSQQVSMIAMGLAGTSRVFTLMDEESEKDEGYVTLVNAREENGTLTECA
jgi:ATP-binding cassette subfamily B protein